MEEIKKDTTVESEAKITVDVDLASGMEIPPKNIVEKIKRLVVKRKFVVVGSGIVLFLLVSAGLAFAFIQWTAGTRRISFADRLIGKAGNGNDESLEEPFPGEIRDQESPINGELYTKSEMEEIQSRYPLAIVVENHVDARPQSGLNEADIVFEFLAEGGITRLLPVYWGQAPEEVGPVRSLRKYIVDMAGDYNAILKHVGWAEGTGNADTDAAAYLYNTGFKSFYWGGYGWRSADRVAPHNYYTSTGKLWKEASDRGWSGKNMNVTSWKFKNDAELELRPSSSEVSMTFSHGTNSYGVRWVYDKDSNSYKRENAGVAFIDKVTGLQLEAKNVIVQKIERSYPQPVDDKNRIILNMIGSGDALIFRDGEVVEAKWEKSTLTARTRYTDTNGNEVVFNRGKVWVEMVPLQSGRLEGELNYN